MVTRLINSVMLDGKKGVAQKIVYDAFDIVKEKSGNDPLEMFEKALENIMPSLEVKARRVGGSTYQVPMEAVSYTHLWGRTKQRTTFLSTSPPPCRRTDGKEREIF